MLRAENKQTDFFDNFIWERALPEENILLEIKEQIGFSFVEEEISSCYIIPIRRGRPPYHPGVLFRMLFLEYWDNLSDREISRQCRYNLLYRRFVGLGLSEEVPDDTTLVRFRIRLGV
jgi:transposase